MTTIILFAPLIGSLLCGFGYKWFGEKPAADSATATIAPGHGHPGMPGYDDAPVKPSC